VNANTLAKNYGSLTPDERFRLILAASGRGDHAERDRLADAGGRMTLSVADISPHCRAFAELAMLTYIELLEEAARYHDALDLANDELDDLGDEDGEDDGGEGEEEEPEAAEQDPGKGSVAERTFNLALAAGFVLKTKVEGWSLFCEQMNVPPFLVWEGLPGLDRLRHAMGVAEKAAFVSEGFLRWLNHIRPAGKPELAEVPLSAEAEADAAVRMFRARVELWNG
jgi:hypothetical protein